MGVFSDIKVAYYSGTGCAKMVAQSFHGEFIKMGCNCTVEKIAAGEDAAKNDCDLLVLVFPVHAFNAPDGVYKWIDKLNAVNKTPAAVISVSAGGEVSPNTACRVSSIKRLEKKGYDVFYEKMFVMPSNFMDPTNEQLAIRLLQVLPQKVAEAVNEIICGIHVKSSPLFIDRIISFLGELEKPSARMWGRSIRVQDSCDSCGWCAKNCPSGNISILNGKVMISNKCHMCLKCIYGCHKGAIKPGIMDFIIIKEGFNLNDLSKKAENSSDKTFESLTKKHLWSGVKKYLSE